MRTICIMAVLLGVGPLGLTSSSAQRLPRAEDKAEADRLFERGRALLASGDRAEACKLFDLSIRKDPRAVGTMLNVGLCREEVGQLATASRLYAEARDRAHDQQLTEHVAAAERKLALLAPRVPHLALILPVGLPASTRILIDDLVITADAAGDVSLDPGSHTVVVTAPGKLPYESKLELAEAEHRKLTVPPLEGAKTVIVREPTNRRVLLGKIIVASGAVVLGGGVGLALLARSQYWDEFPSGARDGIAMDAEHDCWTALDADSQVVRECNARGRDATSSAHRLSQFGIGAAIAGGVIAIGGTVLWLTAPRREPTAPMITLDLAPGRAGLMAVGRF